MKRTVLFALLMLSLLGIVNGQSGFVEGYFITLQGDTVYGWVRHQNDHSLSEKCVFKRSLSGPAEEYAPSEIHSYRFIDGRYFVSKEIYGDEDDKRCFLEYLLQGEINLYSLKESRGMIFYFEKPGEGLIEVRPEIVTKYVDGHRITEPSKDYIGVLKVVFSDAPAIQEKANDVVLNKKSLIDISIEYHNAVCAGGDDCVVYKKKLPKSILSVSGIIGYGTYKFESKPTAFLNPESATNVHYLNDFEIDKGWTGGLSFKIDLPCSNRRLALSYEVVVVAYHVGSIWKLGNQIEGDYEIRATDLSHNIILGYKLLSRALKPGLYGGGFIAHHLQVHKTGLSDNPHFGEIYPEQLYFGFLAGAGISYEAFENRDLTLKLLYKIGFDNFAYFKTGQFVVSLTLPFFNIKL